MNLYDSLTFILPRDPSSGLLYRSLPTVEERKKAGTEFRTKFHRVNLLLIIECRKRVHRRKDLPTNDCWKATSLETELETIQEYSALFSEFLIKHCRSKSEFDELFAVWKNKKLDYGKYAVVVIEYSYYRIAQQQLSFAKVMERIVSGLLLAKDKSKLKQLYSMPHPDVHFEILTDLEVQLGLSRYLEQLYHCPL